MGKESYIGGDYIETTGGISKIFGKGISNFSEDYFLQNANNGVGYNTNEDAPKIECGMDDLTYIIIVGTQNHRSDASLKKPWNLVRDVGEGSKLMFVHQALRRMRLNGAIKFDFLLCITGYSSSQRKAIKDAVENKFGGKYIEVSNAQQIINYINTGNKTNTAAISDERKLKKVQQLIFYSHGIVGEISLGLGPAGIDITPYSFEEKETEKLSSEAFSFGANIYLFSCRSGIGNADIDRTIYKNPNGSKTDPNNRYNILSSESIAQKIANSTKSTVFAYLRRTDYEKTLFTTDELCFSDYMKARAKRLKIVKNKRCNNKYAYLLNQNYELTNFEKNRWKEWQQIEFNMQRIDGAWFDPDGARHNVEAAPSPEGVPNDMKTFRPQK